MKKSRTCILQTHSEENEDLYQLTLPNHAEYAGVHRYDMLQLHRGYREIWWDIEECILDAIGRYDRVLTVGSDVIFTDMGKPLSHFDDGEHCVFVQEEGLGYPCINFDLVLWTRPEARRHGVSETIDLLRQTRPRYEEHRYGLQTGLTMLSKERADLIKTYPPKFMQGAPFPNYPGTWAPGDFALHFLGMNNKEKFNRTYHFLATGRVLWRNR